MKQLWSGAAPGYLAVGGPDRLVWGFGANPSDARTMARKRAIEAGEYSLAADEGFSIYYVEGAEMDLHVGSPTPRKLAVGDLF
jgi:hypothetical protein